MLNKRLTITFVFGLIIDFAEAESRVEDYFAMLPAELAALPITSIASGSPKILNHSASVTSVISAEQIKSMGATELHDVLETIPGIHAGLQGLTGDYRYSVRGIDNATNSELLILLDGTRVSTAFLGTLTTATELPLEGIERIEVIRGPGSALCGADAFAGVVNIIPKKAADIKTTTLGARVGNWGTHSGWGNYSTQAAGWNIAANMQYQNTDGDPDRILSRDVQTSLDKLIGTSASRAPAAMNSNYRTLNGHLNLQRKHWKIGLWAYGADSGTRTGVSFALDPNGKLSSENYLGDIHFSSEDWSQTWELTSHISYLHTRYDSQFQSFPNNTILPIGANDNLDFRLSNAKMAYFPNGANAIGGWNSDTPTVEFGGIYRGFSDHVLRMNTSYRYEQVVTNYQANYGPGALSSSSLLPAPAVNSISGNLKDLTGTPYAFLADAHRSVWSLVLQDEWQISKAWQFTGGLRYDYYTDFGHTLNPRAALVWDINNHLTSKLLYGRAFRAPSFSELGNQNTVSRLGNKNLKPETIDTMELALDFHPTSSLRLANNFFYYQLHDFIELVANKDKTVSKYFNNSHQEAFGTEFEWNWQPNAEWEFTGNYAWQHSTTTSTQYKISGSPEHHVYAAGIWKFLPQWQIQSQINWIGNRGHNVLDTRPLNDYQTIDFILRGKKLFDKVNFSAVVRNAFDTQYTEQAATQSPVNVPMPGRSFYFEASVNF